MSKMKVHAIVGSGTAPTAVIQEGLRDAVTSKDAVSLLWLGPPNDTMEDIYDFVMENEIAFQMFYADGVTPARVFREAENGAVQKVRDPFKSALQSVANGGKVLFLWSEEEDDSQITPVFDIIEPGTLVLELTNGLAPISMDMDIPEPVAPVLAKDEDEKDEDTDFTKQELEVMTAFAVKRYGERMGCKATTKGAIIQELFPEPPNGEDEEGVEVEPVGPAVSAAAAPSPTLPNTEMGDILTELEAGLYDLETGLQAVTRVLTQIAEKVYRS